MKVLHVCESLQGGTGTHLNELLPLQLAQRGVSNVRLLAPDTHLAYIPDIDPRIIRIFLRPRRATGLPFLALGIIRALWSERPDLLHAHSTFAGFFARLIAPFFRVPVVYCPHGWAMDIDQSCARKRAIAWVEKNLARFCRKIIAVSKCDRDQGVALGIAPEKIAVVHNGIAPEIRVFTPLVWTSDKLKVLFVGRLDRQKGIDILLEAIAGLEDRLSVHVIGDGVVGQDKIDFSPFPHVELFGWLPAKDVVAQLDAADLVVMPSRWEGLPIVALEAMRQGKPIVASTVGGLPEAVIDGLTGRLFPARDAGALQKILLSLSKSDLALWGAAGHAHFLLNFTASIMFEGIEKVYRDLSLSENQNPQ